MRFLQSLYKVEWVVSDTAELKKSVATTMAAAIVAAKAGVFVVVIAILSKAA